jgi:hypothetical protein
MMMLAVFLRYGTFFSYQSVNGARLGEHEATLAGSLRVVFHVKVARVEHAVCFFRRTHACERSEDDLVLELQAADCNRLEHRSLFQGLEAGRRYSRRHDGVCVCVLVGDNGLIGLM